LAIVAWKMCKVNKLIQPLYTLLKQCLPNQCSICAWPLKMTTIVSDLCSDCWKDLPWIYDRCYICCERLEQEKQAIICERCQYNPPSFDRMSALFSYEPPVRKLVTGLKFSNQLAYGRILGELLADKIHQWYKNMPLPDGIIPVPLHSLRLRKRGYNQVLELLRPFKNQKHVPVLIDACTRVRPTQPQSALNSIKRKRNLKNAFQVSLHKSFKHIAVVDDVVTTGATVNAISVALKKAGVDQVDIWCICRA